MGATTETNGQSWTTLVWTAIRHNTGLVAAILLSGLMVLWMFGCESQTKSLADPTVKVTRSELDVEYGTGIKNLQLQMADLQSQYKLRFDDLAKQDEIRAKLLEMGMLVAQGGSLNPTGLIGIVAGILGVGVVVDNRRKDTVIQVQKRDNESLADALSARIAPATA